MVVILDGCVDVMSAGEMVELADVQAQPKVSLLLPTHRGPLEADGDRRGLANLVGEAELALRAKGLRGSEVAALLAPVTARLTPAAPWRDMAEGLALFLAPGWSASYRLPYSVGPIAVVGEQFHLAPLVAHATGQETFWLLALSRHTVRLWRAGAFTLDEHGLPGVPRREEDALRFEESPEQLNLHATRAGLTGGAAVYHGHGGEPDDHNSRFARFVQIIDPGLTQAVGVSPGPVVLAATDDDAARFTAISGLRDKVIGVVTGNPDRSDPATLHAAALPILGSRRTERLVEVLARMSEALSHGGALADVPAILAAGHAGRIDTLVIGQQAACWGAVTEDDTAVLHDQRSPDSADLLGLATVQALRTGATLHVAPTEQLPAPAVALLRY